MHILMMKKKNQNMAPKTRGGANDLNKITIIIDQLICV